MVSLDMNHISTGIYLNNVEKQRVSAPSLSLPGRSVLVSSLAFSICLPCSQPVLGRLWFCQKVTNQVHNGAEIQDPFHPPERRASLSLVHRQCPAVTLVFSWAFRAGRVGNMCLYTSLPSWIWNQGLHMTMISITIYTLSPPPEWSAP